MKTPTERMRERLRKDRPMAVISLRIPDDVIEELKTSRPLSASPAINRSSARTSARASARISPFWKIRRSIAHREPPQARHRRPDHLLGDCGGATEERVKNEFDHGKRGNKTL